MTDLLERRSTALNVPRAGANLPVAPKTTKQRRHFPIRKWLTFAAVTAAVALVALSAYDRLITALMHDQRQRHLAADLRRGRPLIDSGQAFGVLQIPKLGVNEVVIEGANSANLRSGPAIARSATLPGQVGSLVVFGHREVYGGPFRNLPQLRQGDPIFLEARNKAPVIQYAVDSVYRQVDGTTPTIPVANVGSATLVLVTSGDGWLDRSQIIVTATAPATVADGSAPNVDGSLAADRDQTPASLELLLANLVLACAVLVWKLLRSRRKSALAYLVTSPIVALALITFAMFADSLLPVTR
jgi:sortase A